MPDDALGETVAAAIVFRSLGEGCTKPFLRLRCLELVRAPFLLPQIRLTCCIGLVHAVKAEERQDATQGGQLHITDTIWSEDFLLFPERPSTRKR